MKKLLIIAICLFGLSPFLKAQMLNLNYQISLPMNQVKDFTDKASFRGFDIEYHQFLGDQFSIGAAIGWDVFYKDKNTLPEISDSMEIVMYIRLPGISIVISIRCLC